MRTVSSASGREVLAAAVVDAVAEAARRRPLLVVIEDLHWSDPASLLVLRAVADAVAALPVMLLFTCRDDPQEASPQVSDQLADLPTGVRRMPLPPIDVDEVADLAGGVVGRTLSDRDVRDLHARTGGNPFFVHEVTRLMLGARPVGRAGGAARRPGGAASGAWPGSASRARSLLTAAAVAAESADGRDRGRTCSRAVSGMRRRRQRRGCWTRPSTAAAGRCRSGAAGRATGSGTP